MKRQVVLLQAGDVSPLFRAVLAMMGEVRGSLSLPLPLPLLPPASAL